MPATVFSIDVSAIMKPGVYVLRRGDRVAYVGRARVSILFSLTNHVIRNRTRSLAAWWPTPVIRFDSVEAIPCDPVRAVAIASALVALHSPTHSTTPRPEPAPDQSPASPVISHAPPALESDRPRRLA